MTRYPSWWLVLCAVVLTTMAPRVGADEERKGGGTVLFGFYTNPDGEKRPGRYILFDDGTRLEITLARYGQTPVHLPVVAYDRDSGVVEVDWEGNPRRRCKLTRKSGTHFEGDCIEGDAVLPMVIRKAIREDAEMMGRHLEASMTDLAILDRARQMFSRQQGRNKEGERNCDDDLAAGRVSLFCSLYLASVEVAGTYLHWRPAMSAVRMELVNRFRGDYPHLLQDVNNDSRITDQALTEALDAARARIESRLAAATP